MFMSEVVLGLLLLMIYQLLAKYPISRTYLLTLDMAQRGLVIVLDQLKSYTRLWKERINITNIVFRDIIYYDIKTTFIL